MLLVKGAMKNCIGGPLRPPERYTSIFTPPG